MKPTSKKSLFIFIIYNISVITLFSMEHNPRSISPVYFGEYKTEYDRIMAELNSEEKLSKDLSLALQQAHDQSLLQNVFDELRNTYDYLKSPMNEFGGYGYALINKIGDFIAIPIIIPITIMYRAALWWDARKPYDDISTTYPLEYKNVVIFPGKHSVPSFMRWRLHIAKNNIEELRKKKDAIEKQQ